MSPKNLLIAISTDPPPKKGDTTFLTLFGNNSKTCPTAKDFPPAYLIVDKATLLYLFSTFSIFTFNRF